MGAHDVTVDATDFETGEPIAEVFAALESETKLGTEPHLSEEQD